MAVGVIARARDRARLVPLPMPLFLPRILPRLRTATRLGLRLLISIGFVAVVAGLLLRFAGDSGISWSAVAGTLRQVEPAMVGLLAVVWVSGLWCHSWVLTTAMPGLSRPRAMLLNVCSSAIADLIPFGAAAGTGVQLAMMRSWRIPAVRFAGFTAICNLWNVLAKLGLPSLVLSSALLSGSIHSPVLLALTRTALVFSLALASVAVAMIADERVLRAVGRLADTLLCTMFRRVGSGHRTSLAYTLPAVRDDMVGVIRRGWPRLTAGVMSYLLIQGVLWGLCLHAVGGRPSLTATAAGFTVERVLSMVPFTPGGAGLAEAGSIGLLVSLGGAPVTTAAGVLLYRGFAFLLEIPVGGAGLLGWLWLRRRSRRAVLLAPAMRAPASTVPGTTVPGTTVPGTTVPGGPAAVRAVGPVVAGGVRR